MASALLRVLSLSIAGVSVLKCQEWDVIGETVYVMTFTVMGIAEVLCYVIACDFCLSCYPGRPGLAGGVYGVSLSIGTLVASQIIIALRILFYDYRISVGTIFFALGIYTIVMSQPLLPLLDLCTGNKRIRQQPISEQKDLESVRSDTTSDQATKISVRNVIRVLKNWPVIYLVVAFWLVFIPIEGIVAVLEPIEFSLWNDKLPPAATLSAIALGMLVIGRLFWCLVADYVGLSRLFLFVLLIQGCSLLTIGLLTTGLLTSWTQDWVKYATIVILNFYLFLFPAVKLLTPGLSYQVLEYEDGMVILSVLNIVIGVSGIIGPVAIRTMYNIHDRYDIAFCCCGGLVLMAFILTACLGNVTTSCCSRRQERSSIED